MAFSIVTSAAKQLGSLVVEEVKYLYEVTDKIERLQRDLLWMRCFLEDAGNKQHKEKVVSMWVSEMRDFAYEAQEIIESYLHHVSHHRRNGVWNTVKWFSCSLCDARALHDTGSKIDDLRRRISELIRNLQLYGVQMSKQEGSLEANLAMREQRRTYSHTKETPIGLENHIKEVVHNLVGRDEIKVVGICGIGGLGKSTLARQVFSDTAIKDYFKSNCVWVYISKYVERRKIFEEILRGLISIPKDEIGRNRTKDQTNEVISDDDLPKKICKVLKDKQCLVVLDDVWKNGDWDTLKPAFESINESRSKILITTRYKGLVRHASPSPSGYSHPFGVLNNEDSWKLLQFIVFLKEERPGKNMEKNSSSDTTEDIITEREEGQAGGPPTTGTDQTDQTKLQENEVEDKETLAKEMLQHCKGLPLAIVALGGVLLNKKTISEWKTVQKNISYYLMNNVEQGSESQGLFAVLELSYYDLPYYLKPCFMYLGIFPEDYEIEAERLFHLWQAEGLVTSAMDGRDEIQDVPLDDIAEMYLSQLVERSMVQVVESWPNGRIKSCQLHDVMRDMCLEKCKEVNFLNIVEEGSSSDAQSARSTFPLNRRMRRCALHFSKHSNLNIEPYLGSTPCIRSLLVFPDGDKQSWKLLSRRKFFSLLRVLDLEGCDLPMMPRIIGDFIHLRFLRLTSVYISALPQRVWDCKYLETLDLQTCVVGSLSNKLWKLERLKHLYLPYFERLKGPPKLHLKVSQLKQMETFKNFRVDICRIGDLLQMSKLRNFSFIEEGWEWREYMKKEDLEVLLRSPVIKSKHLVNPLCLLVEANMINEDPSIVTRIRPGDITISGFKIRGRIAVALDDSVGMIFPHSLASVTLHDCEIGREGICMLGKLPGLKELRLRGNAVEGNKMSFCDGSFPCLAELYLWGLRNLEDWEVGEGSALPSLRILEIIGCPKLKLIPGGLPKSAQIVCIDPCIEGIDKYATCPEANGTDDVIREPIYLYNLYNLLFSL